MFILLRHMGVRTIFRIQVLAFCSAVLVGVPVISGCSAIVSSANIKMANNLSYAILNNDDLETVETGGPAYLLMIDGMLRDDPDNRPLLRTAATLYSAYTAVFIADKMRSQKLTEKALGYAFHAACLRRPDICLFRNGNFKTFADALAETDVRDVPELHALGAAWSGWIRARADDWGAISEMARAEAVMQRVVDLDEFYRDGEAHLYLGIFSTLLPPALGGKPELGRTHFERAMEISGDKNLMVKVMYARQYARMIFDRELHDRLLNEVLKANPYVPGYVLVNMYAQKSAKNLLETADEFF